MACGVGWRYAEHTESETKRISSRAVAEIRTTPCDSKIEVKYVMGDSMDPLLQHGEMILVDRDYYRCHEIERGDLVLVEYPGRERLLVKQVKGIPTDRFHFQVIKSDYILYVNDVEVTNSLGQIYTFDEVGSRALQAYAKADGGIISPDRYLILGEQLDLSLDSTEYGLFSRNQIVGRVWKN